MQGKYSCFHISPQKGRKIFLKYFCLSSSKLLWQLVSLRWKESPKRFLLQDRKLIPMISCLDTCPAVVTQMSGVKWGCVLWQKADLLLSKAMHSPEKSHKCTIATTFPLTCYLAVPVTAKKLMFMEKESFPEHLGRWSSAIARHAVGIVSTCPRSTGREASWGRPVVYF